MNADVNSVNRVGTSPLMVAAAQGDLASMRILLQANADLTLKDQDGRTALDWARRSEHSDEAVEYLTKFAEGDHSMGQQKSSLPPRAPSLPSAEAEKFNFDDTLDAVVVHGSSRWKELGKAMGFAADEVAAITELKANDEGKLKALIASKLALAGRADVQRLLMDACKIIEPPIISKVKREIHVKESTVTLVVEKDEDVDLLLTVLTKHLRVKAVELGRQLGMTTDRVSEVIQGAKSEQERLKRIFATLGDEKQLSRHQASRRMIVGFSRTCIDDHQFEVMLEELVFVLARQTASFSEEEMSLFKRELAKGYVQIGRARINVVGQDRCGKTCFIRALLKLLFERQKSTEGTAIRLVSTEAENWHQLMNDGQKLATLDGMIGEAAMPEDSDVDEAEEDVAETQTKETQALPESTGYVDKETKSSSANSPLKSDESFSKFTTTRSTSKMKINDVLKKEAKLTRLLIKKFIRRKGNRKGPIGRGFRILYSIWDHGGQEPYLPAHCALLDDYAVFSCGMYIIVFDQSKPLNAEAESFFCSNPFRRGKKLELRRIKLNKDHVAHWLTQITLSASKHAQSHQQFGEKGMGFSVGVEAPPVFFVGTHDDHEDAEKNRTQQNEILDDLIFECPLCEKHCVKPERDKSFSFFRVDNTKSGLEGQDPAEEVRELIDRITEAYWSQPGCKQAQPVSYLALEKMLTLYKQITLEMQETGGHICDKEVFDQLATELCGIESHGTATALKYFSTLGVVLHYPEVKGSRGSSFTAGLKDKIFIDPQWISKLASKFGTCKEPEPMVIKEWREVQTTGIMAWKLVDYFLNEDDIRVSEEERKPALTVLCLLDILCPRDGDIAGLGKEMDFYVPGLLLKMFEGQCRWQRWTKDSGLPPPLVLAPLDVQHFPETLFFRLVVRALQRYPTNPQLCRNRCLVHAVFESDFELDLELVYYDRRCVLVTVAFATVKKPKMVDSDIRVRQHCEQLRTFVLENLDDAKMRGMSGFKFETRVCPDLPQFFDSSDRNLDDLVSISRWRPVEALYSPRNERISEKSVSLFALWFEPYKCISQTPLDGAEGCALIKDDESYTCLPDGKRKKTEQTGRASPKATRKRTDREDSSQSHYSVTVGQSEELPQPPAKRSKHWHLDDLIDAVVSCGQDKWFAIGRKLRVSYPRIEAITADKPDHASKLYAIIEEKRRDIGNETLSDMLLDVCKDVNIHGGVMDKLESTFS